MNRRLISLFLRDQSGWIVAFCLNTGVLLLLLLLVRQFQGADTAVPLTDAAYALLLSSIILGLRLAIQYVRWSPFMKQSHTLLDDAVGLEALNNLPPGGTAEQEILRKLLEKCHSLALAEQLRYQDAHQRQLAFINLWVHQMKTPVSAISLIAQQAGDDGADPAAAMAGVEEETAKLADGLDLVLNMARLQDFALDYHIRRIDLLSSVRRVINSRKKQFIRLSIFPEIETDGDEWPILTDEKWNSFAIDQIIANALKYGSQGGPAGQRLKVRLSRDGGWVVLAITDQGPGIPPQDLPRVFDAFFTGINGRRYANATGIGLYLVKQVMHRLEHEITITSTPGEGTTVSIRYKDLRN